MCGICGEWRRDGRAADREAVRRMTDMLSHRGPDGEGFLFGKPDHVALGQRRLSVIDLPGGKQPMSNEDGTVWISFNGEVYNFGELRVELEKRGHVFRTNSDTEVIIHQYEEDGPDCVRKFNGMFAFAVWDAPKRRLFLARDRLGIKPLYYHSSSDRFVFSSEIRPLVAALAEVPPYDRAALWAFLVIRYVPAPRTLFSGIRKLLPGHFMIVDDRGEKIERYWRVPDGGDPIGEDEAIEGIRALLDDSVKKRLIADVPLGAFLSGGVDSTALVATMRKYKGEGLKTFSVDFHADAGADYVNETRWAELAARTFQTDHYRLTVSAADMVESLPTVAERLDDLVSDPAVIPTYLVSRFARRQVTVCLSGEGGDELFGGYQRYMLAGLTGLYRALPPALTRRLFVNTFKTLPRMRRARKGLAALAADTPAARHLAWLATIDPGQADLLIGPDSGGREMVEGIFEEAFTGQRKAFDLDRTLRLDLESWLPDDLLTKVDRASMAVGLEARVPFLDHRMVELAARIPARLKTDFFRGKKIFKKAVADRVPAAIIARKKAGFALPLDEWMRGELKEMVRDLLGPDSLARQGVFDPKAAEAMLHEHMSGRERQGYQLFSLLIFELWKSSINDIRRGSRTP